jgi:hypothetical protein
MFIFLLIVFFGAWSSCSWIFPSSKNYYEDGIDDPGRPVYYIVDHIRDLLVAFTVTFICFILFS